MNDGALRILVVDDERGFREGCRKILTSEGYDVETAEDGVAGLELFKARGNFAAALVDLKMPRMDGIELIKRIHEYDEDAVLLVITAYATIDTAVEVTKRGAYAYIPKPFTPDEVLLPVKNGLERRALSIEAKRLREERENRLLEVAYERSKSNTIIQCMTDGILVVNLDRQIVLRNAAAARIMQDYASFPVPFPLNALDCKEMTELIIHTLDADSGPVIVSKEVTLGQCMYMVNVSPVIELNDRISGVVAVIRDVTALKKLETAKSMFVSMVAHEIKSPLGAAEGYLELILSGLAGDPQKQKQMIERSLIRIRTLRTMVSELMDLTALETGKFTIKRSPLDIREVVTEAVELHREKANEKDIELSLAYGADLESERVLADKDAMLIVFKNLIENAIKYTPEKGHVDVRMEQNGIYVKVNVKDDGIGMTPDEKERAFDEFFRAKNEYTARIPGTGLGLSLVKQLLEMHQGKITLETAPGKGSEFTVRLPIVG
jgi:two-component system phosphate regulon sensor histidine kinase PhoR